MDATIGQLSLHTAYSLQVYITLGLQSKIDSCILVPIVDFLQEPHLLAGQLHGAEIDSVISDQIEELVRLRLEGSGINQQESITQHGPKMAVPMRLIVPVVIFVLDLEGIFVVVPQGELFGTISDKNRVHCIWFFSLVNGIE